MSETRTTRSTVNPWLVLLVAVGVAAGVLGFILGVVAAEQSDSLLGDVAAAAALTVWSNFLMLVAVVSLVGALVVGGVTWTLRRAGLDV